MIKKISIALAAIIIVSILIKFFAIDTSSKVRANNLIKYIPQSVALIIESDNIQKIMTQLTDNENEIWSYLTQLDPLFLLQEEFAFLDSALNSNKEVVPYLSNNLCEISFHFMGKREPEVLYQIARPENADNQDIDTLLHKLFATHASISKKTYENTEIAIFQLKSIRKSFFLCKNEESILFSSSEILIEETIRKKDKANTFSNQSSFTQIYNKLNKDALANVFINIQNFASVLEAYTSNNINTNTLQQFPNWIGFDMLLENNAIYLNGLTNPMTDKWNYLRVFKGQMPQKSELIDIFPENTAAFISVSLTDIKLFNQNYKNYLEQTSQINAYKAKIANLKEKTSLDFELFFNTYLGKELALVYTTDNQIEEPVIVAQLNDQNNAQEELLTTLKALSKADSTALEENISTLIISAKETYDIYHFSIANPLSILYGSIFKSPNAKYYTIFDEYLLIGSSVEKLENFINSYAKNKLFKNTNAYNELTEISKKKNTILLYSEPILSKKLYYFILNKKYAQELKLNQKKMNKYLPFVLQIAPSNFDNFYDINFSILFDKNKKPKIEKHWELTLDTLAKRRPQLFKNHYNGDFEIFTQDENNNIYLIDRNGTILFKRHIKYKIQGEAKQIDYYTNTKLQILFAAGDELYLIDREGKDVEKFPVKLPSKSVNGVAVFDYENDRKYRFFVAAANKQVYAYSKEGELLSSWKFKASSPIIKLPKHVRIDNNDYILIATRQKFQILNRKGEERIKLKTNVVIAENASLSFINSTKPYILSTNADAEIVKIYFDGTVKTHKLTDMDTDCFFTSSDIDNNQKNDYIVVSDKTIEIYDYNYNSMKKYESKETLSGQPLLFSFSNDKKMLGIFSKEDNLIYLFDSKLRLHDLFPLPATSAFVISFPEQSEIGMSYSLICSGENAKLISYKIED